MIRLSLETADIERLLQGKTVTKHKQLPGGSRARQLGVVVEIEDWCPLCGTRHAPDDGPAGYSCAARR